MCLPDSGRGRTPILAVPAQFPAAQMCVRKKARAKARSKERFIQLLSNMQRKTKNAGIRTGANASIFSLQDMLLLHITETNSTRVQTST
jgi:hypothetical protein